MCESGDIDEEYLVFNPYNKISYFVDYKKEIMAYRVSLSNKDVYLLFSWFCNFINCLAKTIIGKPKSSTILLLSIFTKLKSLETDFLHSLTPVFEENLEFKFRRVKLD